MSSELLVPIWNFLLCPDFVQTLFTVNLPSGLSPGNTSVQVSICAIDFVSLSSLGVCSHENNSENTKFRMLLWTLTRVLCHEDLSSLPVKLSVKSSNTSNCWYIGQPGLRRLESWEVQTHFILFR